VDEQDLKYIDKTTQLKNREYFINLLYRYFKEDNSSVFGVNILAALDDVKKANKKIGYLEVDKFLVKISEIFKKHTKDIDNSIVARMNGSEFCFFLPNCSDHQALKIAKKIKNDIEILIDESNLNGLIEFSLGLYGFTQKEDVSQLLAASDEALSKALLNRDNIYQKSTYLLDEVMSIEKWQDVINRAISSNNFYFISFKAVDIKNKKVLHNRLSISLKDDDNIIYRYSQFIPIVNRLNLIDKLYNNVLEMMFKTPDKTLDGFICSIRLPYDYLVFKDTYKTIRKILQTYKNNLGFKLIIEIPDEFAYKYFKESLLYKELFKEYNIEIGLYEFQGGSDNFYYLKDLTPVYVKGDASYFIKLDDKLLSTIKILLDNMDIPLIATNVKDKDILEKLEEKDIYLIQGSVSKYL